VVHFLYALNRQTNKQINQQPPPPKKPKKQPPGIVKAVAKALGKEPKIVYYDPEAVGTGKGGKAEGFPFRTVHFFASSDKAKRELGWKPAHDFLGDAPALVAEYQKSGRVGKDIDFAIDDKILAAV
jgi:hypothetical protein